MTINELITGLPGEELIREGLADLAQERRTIPAWLAAIGWPRLRRAGLIGELNSQQWADAELHLYRLLRREGGDAYSRYNALVRQLVSFESALDRRLARTTMS